ncbi:MAG: hypothetical protein M0C28_23155 [Candidatus Moduliflexus flocculans]|nr:hypothetical protein [Candidatus Moduliflexus flocculans]
MRQPAARDAVLPSGAMHVDTGAARPVEAPAGRGLAWLGALSALLLAAVLAARGHRHVPRSRSADVFRVVAARLGFGAGDANLAGVAAAVVWNLRIPAGRAGRASSARRSPRLGAVFQASFRNPLVEPLHPRRVVGRGVRGGAGHGRARTSRCRCQLAAFLGALAAVGLVHLLARSRGRCPDRHAGAFRASSSASMFAAGVSLLKYLADDSGAARHRLLADGRVLLRDAGPDVVGGRRRPRWRRRVRDDRGRLAAERPVDGRPGGRDAGHRSAAGDGASCWPPPRWRRPCRCPPSASCRGSG